jgi:NAD(P)-dependent dehydrogenase (short-subunit alcohol dehydrogenase family)
VAERWGARAIPDLTGRTALVTGANSGLGYETARALAHRGATVLLACRDEQRGAGARDRLRTEDPAGRVELVMLDLADLDSVRRSADEVLQRDGTLDLSTTCRASAATRRSTPTTAPSWRTPCSPWNSTGG